MTESRATVGGIMDLLNTCFFFCSFSFFFFFFHREAHHDDPEHIILHFEAQSSRLPPKYPTCHKTVRIMVANPYGGEQMSVHAQFSKED